MIRLRRLSALLCATCLMSCAPRTVATFQPPPPALVAPLPADPVVPDVVTDQTLGQYVVDLRAALRVARARFEALAGWAVK